MTAATLQFHDFVFTCERVILERLYRSTSIPESQFCWDAGFDKFNNNILERFLKNFDVGKTIDQFHPVWLCFRSKTAKLSAVHDQSSSYRILYDHYARSPIGSHFGSSLTRMWLNTRQRIDVTLNHWEYSESVSSAEAVRSEASKQTRSTLMHENPQFVAFSSTKVTTSSSSIRGSFDPSFQNSDIHACSSGHLHGLCWFESSPFLGYSPTVV